MFAQVRMEPLCEAIGAHLCCGLSHVDPDIQRDALKVLDEVVAHAPRVVAACAAQVRSPLWLGTEMQFEFVLVPNQPNVYHSLLDLQIYPNFPLFSYSVY